MFLNQVRLVSSGAGLLGVYALDRRKQIGSKLNENPDPSFCPSPITVSDNVFEFPKLQNVSDRLNLAECSELVTSSTDCDQENLQNLVKNLP